MPCVIYHYPCQDGVFAALAAFLGLKEKGALTFCPLTTWAKPAEKDAIVSSCAAGDSVYLLDISGGSAFVRALCAKASGVYLLDHHKAAFELLEELEASGGLPATLHPTLSLVKSGCMLAYEHFQAPATLLPLFSLVQDNDLFTHALPGSQALAAALGALKLELDPAKAPSLWDALLALDHGALIASGTALLQQQAATRAAEREAAFSVRIPAADAAAPPLQCLALISAHPDLRSEAGAELAALSAQRGLAPAGVVAYVEEGMGEGMLKVSLRSTGELDVALVCKAFGGNGHRCVGSRAGTAGLASQPLKPPPHTYTPPPPHTHTAQECCQLRAPPQGL